jgi:hypothetical protein
MNKFLYVLILITLIFTGCCSELPIEKQKVEADLEFELDIKSGVEKYSMLMSSVPGLPIEIGVTSHVETYDYEIVVSTNYGELSSWDEDGAVTRLGDNVTNKFEDCVFYWTPVINYEDELPKDANITVSIYNLKTNEVIDESVGELIKADEIYYKIKRWKN